MARPERQKTILDILKNFIGPDALKQLFWSELNYSRVNTPLPRHKWRSTMAEALAADPVLFATGGDDFHIIHCHLSTDKLMMGLERPVVSQLLKEHPYALFVFSNKAQNHWHFLNVKYDSEVTKRRVFRRITIGPGERLRTASERIALLDLESAGPSLFVLSPLDIQTQHDDAFNKEPLTKDFFKRFDQALEAIKSDLEEYQSFMTSAEAYTQAQLLLERLIFLYFLQNRGWLNQDGRFLLNNLTEHQSKPGAFTYYGEFLDKLFWTLSSAPGEGGRLPGIPFLNGGLFDDDEFRQPSGSRKTNPPLKVRNTTFKSVFDDLLEAFNFTVTEDTPLNQEVAVDPEMLGKVFESIVLHAEAADPDATAPDKRKATGSYYTPRIVVHFICREVLYQYLHARAGLGVPTRGAPTDWSSRLRTLLEMDATDGLDDEAKERLKRTVTPDEGGQLLELVRPLKCCDPAVGSGAFPVGLLHELVNLRRLLATAANGYVDPMRGQGSTWLHDTKADIVQNCLFGVDIQQQAIEICRLRLWLSMVVDYDLGLDPFSAEKSQFSHAINRISQLPNLEMNFHRGDSLHDHICGVPIVILPDRASRHADAFRAIYKLGERLHKAKTGETKRKLRLEILEKRLDLSASILKEEFKAIKIDDSSIDNLFGLDESAAKKRDRLTDEMEKLAEALKEVEKNRSELERLTRRGFDSKFFPKLRKLEGADFDSPFNFAWTVDFPGVFAGGANGGGFDIVVGNPPFVTARNPRKRKLWRQRWPRVCHMKYSLVAPFFEMSFGLLRTWGQLGFIVSNAFAKREFGQPVIEKFFPTVDVQKVVDCSGLMFPGHGTPTCIVLGARHNPDPTCPIRVAALLPGGGDLSTSPEDNPLWHSLALHHDQPGYADSRITVTDRSRTELAVWPWNFDVGGASTKEFMEALSGQRLRSVLAADIGFMFVVGRNDIFMLSPDSARRLSFSPEFLKPLTVGDEIRNHEFRGSLILIFPYEKKTLKLLKFPVRSAEARYFNSFQSELSDRPTFSGTFGSDGRVPYQFHQLPVERAKNPKSIAFSQIATHGHFVFDREAFAFNEKAPLLKLPLGSSDQHHQLLAGLINSSSALFWLKQVCFNKGAGEDEERDRFEYAGGKVEQLPVPCAISEDLQGKPNLLAECLTELSEECWERGQQMPSLSLKKLFEKPGESYYEWIRSLPDYVQPNPELGVPFRTESDLRDALRRAEATRERMRAEMIALQEEMDWLVYAAYGLLPERHPAVATGFSPANAIVKVGVTKSAAPKDGASRADPLNQAERPFRLWQQVEGDYAKAVALIAASWPIERRALWEARLAAMRDNEHIRRIEQPVYKRRWVEQWKVGNEWRSGPVAYAAEFVDAFEWWLSEKAEWWLEHKKNGGPVELDDWAETLWKDSRVQAAWPVAAENYALLEYEKAKAKAEANGEPTPDLPNGSGANLFPNAAAFERAFRRIIDGETVPEGIPYAEPYDELERREIMISPKVKSIRGKLNVPRERFHMRDGSTYLWAGLSRGA